jgi:hypothetical protein
MLVRNREYLHEPIIWHKTNDPEYPYETREENQNLTIRLNDFPEQHLYTLLADAKPIISFDDWPDIWVREADDTTRNLYRDFCDIVSLTRDGGPSVDEIGVALTALVQHLETASRPHQRFRPLIAWIKEVWQSKGVTKNWDEIFFRQAMKHSWPNWAIVELNSLNIPTGVISNGMKRFLIWEIYLPFLEELGVVFDVVYKKGMLLEIDASSEAALFLEKTQFTIEEIRNRSPFRRYRSLLGVANQGFMDLQLYFVAEGETRLAAAVDEGRRTILKSLGLDFPAGHETKGPIPRADLINLLQDFTPQPVIFVGNSG